MKLTRTFATLMILLFLVASLQADITKESKTTLEFKGALGTMMKFMGAGKPFQTADYFKADRLKTDNVDNKGQVTTSQVIDLNRELFLSIDHKKKSYTQMTFAEWRAMMDKNLKEMKTEPSKSKEEKSEVDWSYDVKVTPTGEKEVIAGKNTEKVIIRITVMAKSTDKTQPQDSEMIVTSTNWMAKDVGNEKELQDFYSKMAEKLGFKQGQGGLADIMGSLYQSNPQLADAMKKMQEESAKLTGMSMRVHAVYETKSTGTAPQDKGEEGTEIPTSVGGLLKGFGKKAVQPKKDESSANVLLESSTEIIRYDNASLDANIFEIPSNYKLVKEK